VETPKLTCGFWAVDLDVDVIPYGHPSRRRLTRGLRRSRRRDTGGDGEVLDMGERRCALMLKLVVLRLPHPPDSFLLRRKEFHGEA
jgi:hypothetical protein